MRTAERDASAHDTIAQCNEHAGFIACINHIELAVIFAELSPTHRGGRSIVARRLSLGASHMY